MRFRYVVSGIEIGMSGKVNFYIKIMSLHTYQIQQLISVVGFGKIKSKQQQKPMNAAFFANSFLWHGSSLSRSLSWKLHSRISLIL
jgi:hypothetical protein